MAETTQAPRTEAEREAMVWEEADRQCRDAGGWRGQSAGFPCPVHRERAEAAIPPVSPAPALVTAEEWSRAYGQLIPRELVDRLLATLRHYEAEVGRLKDEVKAWDGTCQQAMQNWKTADVRRKEVEESLAREAPFAALGRRFAKAIGVDYDGPIYFTKWPEAIAARAALAEEKAKEPEVVKGASGAGYRVNNGQVQVQGRNDDCWYPVHGVCIEDAAFVAALLKGVTP